MNPSEKNAERGLYMGTLQKKLSDERLITETFFRLLPYQVLMIAINAVNSIVDSLYASNAIGQSAMSAMGLFAPVNHFLYAAAMMLVSGSQILYGRYISTDHGRVRGVFSVTLLVTFAGSLLVSLLMALSALLGWTRVFAAEEEVLAMFNSYLLGQSIGIVPLLMGQQLFSFLSLENQTRRTTAASLACLLVNIVLDHVLIVFFGMGTFGLGLASALSCWVFFAVQAAFYLAGKSEWRFSLRECVPKDAAEICLLGYPGALSRFVEMFRCFIVNSLLLTFVGSAGLAAFAASNSLLAIIWSVPFGMVAVGRMVLSISRGEEDRRSLIDIMRVLQRKGILIMIVIAGLLTLLAVPLTRLFSRDPLSPVYGMTVSGFRLLPWCMPLSVISLSFAAYAQVMEKKAASLALPITDGVIGVVLFSLILIPRVGMNGLYIANILNGVLCALLVVALSWLERRRFPRSVEDLMAIPASFGVAEDRRMDITVRSMEKVTEVAEKIQDFCLRLHVDPRHAYYAGLCMEEMAGNVISHGFTADRKKHSVDIRLTCKENEVILRLRDDCVAFDPSEHARILNPGEGVENFGIRMVYSLAEEISYQNLLRQNVLTIRLRTGNS